MVHVSSSLQDIPENGADVAHLTYLHGAGVSSGSGMNYRELLSGKLHTHSWTARWESLPEPSTYVGRMTLTMTNSILGVNFKSLDITSIADQVCLKCEGAKLWVKLLSRSSPDFQRGYPRK